MTFVEKKKVVSSITESKLNYTLNSSITRQKIQSYSDLNSRPFKNGSKYFT